MRLRSSIALALACAACSSSPPPASGPIAIFAPPASGKADLSSLPWPSDLYLDAGGHIAIASLTPLQPEPLHTQIIADLARHDGFAVTAGAFFPVSAPLDPATLDVYLYDLESGEALPVVTYFRAAELLLHARPQNGTVLLQHHRYAYVVTDTTHGSDGNPLQPSADFKLMLGPRPSDARLGPAWDLLQPAFAAYAKACQVAGCAGQSSIVAATAFTTQSVSADLEAIHAAIAALAPPTVRIAYVFAASKMNGDDGSLDDLLGTPASLRPGEDNPGGVAHDGMGYVVQGTFDVPDWLAATTPSASPATGTATLVGSLGYGSDGKPMARGTASVPFTLVLPALPPNGSYANLPTVIFTHGLGGDRSAVVAVANTMAKRGFATIGLDLPFHGMRLAKAVDAKHNYSGADGPDGFVDAGGFPSVTSFFDTSGDAARNVAPLDPAVLRGAFQQSVSDLMGMTRLITAGVLDPIAVREPRLAGLSLRQDTVVYSGESFGSIIGGITIAVEPKLGAAVLSVGGGGLIFPLLTWSVDYGPLFTVLLDSSLGNYASTDPPETDFGYNMVEFLLEEGDPIAFAPYVIEQPLAGSSPRHVVLLQAFLDESVPNFSNEALAQGMGLAPSSVTAGGTPSYRFTLPAPTVTAAPISGNRMVGGKPYTAAIVQMQTASHGMFTSQKGARTHDTTVRPFKLLPMPMPLDNPIDALHAIYGQFAADYFAGKVPTVIDAK